MPSALAVACKQHNQTCVVWGALPPSMDADSFSTPAFGGGVVFADIEAGPEASDFRNLQRTSTSGRQFAVRDPNQPG
eukprot:13874473-Alexandrium_andersonii.AAC.1